MTSARRWSGRLLLVALPALAGGCSRETSTALDLRLRVTGAIDQIEVQEVLVDGVAVSLQGETRSFPASPRTLTNTDVVTIWFPDEDHAKPVIVTAVGLHCHQAVTVPIATDVVVLRRGQTVSADLPLVATIGVNCATGGGGASGGGGGSGAGGGSGRGGGGGNASGSGGDGRGGAGGPPGVGGGGSGAVGAGGASGTGVAGSGGGAGVSSGGAGGRGGAAGVGGGSAGSGGRVGTGGIAVTGGRAGTGGAGTGGARTGGAGGAATGGAVGTGGRVGTGGAGTGGAGTGGAGTGGVAGAPSCSSPAQVGSAMLAPVNLASSCGHFMNGTLTHVWTGQNIAWVQRAEYATAAACGRCLEVTRTTMGMPTRTARATVVGECPDSTCQTRTALGLSQSVFASVGFIGESSIPNPAFPQDVLSWRYVECIPPAGVPMNMVARSMPSAAGNPVGVQFLAHRTGIAGVSVQEATLVPLVRASDNFWRMATGGPFSTGLTTFRLTDVANRQVMTTFMLSPLETMTTVQFPACP